MAFSTLICSARYVQINKKLWDLTVFTNRIDPSLEEDVQWVFINNQSVRDGTLLVTSELGNTYQIDLKAKAMTQFDATQSATQDATAHLHDIPEAATEPLVCGEGVRALLSRKSILCAR